MRPHILAMHRSCFDWRMLLCDITRFSLCRHNKHVSVPHAKCISVAHAGSMPSLRQHTYSYITMCWPDCKRQVVHNYAGKSMMGKSSTANSLFNENVAQVTSFQQDTARPQAIRRSAHGFELTVIDTPGLLDSDCVNTAVSVWCPSVVV